MRLNRSSALACAALAFASCSLLRSFQAPAPTGAAELVADSATFDGQWLAVRVLLRARNGGLLVQQDLAPNGGLTVEAVKDCESGVSVPFFEWSGVRAREE